MGKSVRIFGTYYSETDKGRGYVEEFDFVVHLDTELTGGLLKSFIQKKFIETFLRQKFGRDKYKGWQTCDIDENVPENAQHEPKPSKPGKASKENPLVV